MAFLTAAELSKVESVDKLIDMEVVAPSTRKTYARLNQDASINILSSTVWLAQRVLTPQLRSRMSHAEIESPFLLSFLILVALFPAGAMDQTSIAPAAQSNVDKDHRSDQQAIELVIKRFHEAVVAHDGTTLASLFLPDATLWLNVLTDTA